MVLIEVSKSLDDMVVLWLTKLFNEIISTRKMPSEEFLRTYM